MISWSLPSRVSPLSASSRDAPENSHKTMGQVCTMQYGNTNKWGSRWEHCWQAPAASRIRQQASTHCIQRTASRREGLKWRRNADLCFLSLILIALGLHDGDTGIHFLFILIVCTHFHVLGGKITIISNPGFHRYKLYFKNKFKLNRWTRVAVGKRGKGTDLQGELLQWRKCSVLIWLTVTWVITNAKIYRTIQFRSVHFILCKW